MSEANDNRVGMAPEARRRRLLFRAGHRGTREMDILLSRFLDRELDGMSDDELAQFEAMMNIPDQDFYDILVKGAPVPAPYEGPLMDRLIASVKAG